MERMTIAEYTALKNKSKKLKYNNVKTKFEGDTYDSKKEANHAAKLILLKNVQLGIHRVLHFERQRTYDIVINDISICRYIADFVVTFGDGHVEVQDVKSEFTKKLPVYRLKKKLMKAVHGIDIIEV